MAETDWAETDETVFARVERLSLSDKDALDDDLSKLELSSFRSLQVVELDGWNATSKAINALSIKHPQVEFWVVEEEFLSEDVFVPIVISCFSATELGDESKPEMEPPSTDPSQDDPLPIGLESESETE